MSILNPTIYQCNFCGARAEEPEHWLNVENHNPAHGTTKPTDPDHCKDGRVHLHACQACGEFVHRTLLILCIPHEFKVEREPWMFGRIFIP